MSTGVVDDERRLQPGWCAACLVVTEKGHSFCAACALARRTRARNEWARQFYWRKKDRQPDA